MSGAAPESIEARGPLVGWVCGYGSLARLTSPVRAWGVAMDNGDAVSDPKHYVLADDGRRYDGYVAFLDVVPEGGAALGALAIPVDADRLAALDAREVNYDAHDVSDRFVALGGERLPGPVWIFRGTSGARTRAARSGAEGRLAVAAAYVRGVAAAFAAQPDALPTFADSTEPCAWPERDLDLVAQPGLLGY